MEGHVALVAQQLLVGVLLAAAQVAGAHAAGLALVVLAVLAGWPALPWTRGPGSPRAGCQRPPPPPGGRRGQDPNSRLSGCSATGLPSPGRSILKTSSTKTIRQSLREFSLRDTGHQASRGARPPRTTSEHGNLRLQPAQEQASRASGEHLAVPPASSTPTTSDTAGRKQRLKQDRHTMRREEVLTLGRARPLDRAHHEKSTKVKSDRCAYVKTQKLLQVQRAPRGRGAIHVGSRSGG